MIRLIVGVLMERDIAELRMLRDGAFTVAVPTNGQGTLISSSIDGQSFTFSLPGQATLTPLQVAMYAQLAIDNKQAGLCRPVTQTRAFFV
jgi:hypothetical protein